MTTNLTQLKQDFTEGLSQISRFWGFPKGMGAIFAVLYLSPALLSLDEITARTGLTKGAISTEVRALARLGLVHRSSKLADRKDYYEAEADFYQGKIYTFRYFFKYELPKIEGLGKRLQDADGLTVEMKESFFAD